MFLYISKDERKQRLSDMPEAPALSAPGILPTEPARPPGGILAFQRKPVRPVDGVLRRFASCKAWALEEQPADRDLVRSTDGFIKPASCRSLST